MTDRQFVRKHYPNARLDYRLIIQNTLRSIGYYVIMSDNYGEKHFNLTKRCFTPNEAWKAAKKNIIENKNNSTE